MSNSTAGTYYLHILTVDKAGNAKETISSGVTIKILPTVANQKGGGIISTTANTTIKDDSNNDVVVPAGFKIASDSATDASNGVVIEDASGNQFVWIPVANISNYKREAFTASATGIIDETTNSEKIVYNAVPFTNPTKYYAETMPSDEQTSVTNNHGYYIGRYESGDSQSIERINGSSTLNTVAIKGGQVPYNFVTRDQAKTLAEGIKTAQGYITSTTKLSSSYAWDTAISFIQGKVANYGKNSPQGNYTDTTFNYKNNTGETETKIASRNVLVSTGQTTPVCNIYDMGGNLWEWTTEIYKDNSYPCVDRGGCYNYNVSDGPAGSRTNDTSTGRYSIGFRVTLYL